MFMPPQDKINQGLDIQGGLSVVLTAEGTDGHEVTQEDMEKSRSIIESRVNALGASEATVQVQGNNQILVQIPGLSDTQTALETIGRTGMLEFARADSFTDEADQTAIENGTYIQQGVVTDSLGNQFPSGEVTYREVSGSYTPLITGENITRVTVDKESETSNYYAVNLTLIVQVRKHSRRQQVNWLPLMAKSSSSWMGKSSLLLQFKTKFPLDKLLLRVTTL